MKNILVTGGAGFIGSNFIKYMLNKYSNYNIINFDLLTYAGDLHFLKGIIKEFPNYKFLQGDIRDAYRISSILKEYNIDTIINFAAETHVDRSIIDPTIFMSTNAMGTQTLLEAARLQWKKNKHVKFIQISTDEVYGTLGETGKFNEQSPILPNSPYSASKASADLIVRAYHETFGLPINITRCSNNYGPNQHEEKLIPTIIHKALKNEGIPIYGDGLNIRDWLYVEDHCRAIDIILHKGINGEIYNIGGNNEKTNLEITKLILKKLGKSDKLIHFVDDRLGHDRRYAIDNTKISIELNWKPYWSFEKAIDETINSITKGKI